MTLLEQANEIIHGARNESYGHPAEDFRRIAEFWTTYLGGRLGLDEYIYAEDVAAMMVLLKAARLAHNVDHEDSWLDIAGYAGCWERIKNRAEGLE